VKSAEEFSTYTDDDIDRLIDEQLEDPFKASANTLFATMQENKETYDTAVESLRNATNDYNQKNTANIAAQAKVTSAQNYVSECNTIITNLEGQSSANKAATLATLNAQKVEADATLSKVQKEQEQLLVDISKELDLSNQNSAIASKQKEVEELRKATIGTTIVAPFAGTITQINKIAGETTSPEEALVVMQADGKGFTLSFSVTNEQAKLINVGDVAELQNSWYYNDVQVKVASIKPDTTDPGKKKLIGFEINGEVQQGQSLSISVGQKSSNYDLIVPNSAIREDNNGKFVLVIESKSSPLGNRYVATRVDIEVLASDDTQTAISAALNANEYVITTATKPVNAGEQVRLTEQ
ncbi:MAG: HlyD family efflux transporter periplasmic adaptor subunit, partial [Lachnospiraceae bacterium]